MVVGGGGLNVPFATTCWIILLEEGAAGVGCFGADFMAGFIVALGACVACVFEDVVVFTSVFPFAFVVVFGFGFVTTLSASFFTAGFAGVAFAVVLAFLAPFSAVTPASVSTTFRGRPRFLTTVVWVEASIAVNCISVMPDFQRGTKSRRWRGYARERRC